MPARSPAHRRRSHGTPGRPSTVIEVPSGPPVSRPTAPLTPAGRPAAHKKPPNCSRRRRGPSPRYSRPRRPRARPRCPEPTCAGWDGWRIGKSISIAGSLDPSGVGSGRGAQGRQFHEGAGRGSAGPRHRTVRDLPQFRCRDPRRAHPRPTLRPARELIAGSDTLPIMKRGGYAADLDRARPEPVPAGYSRRAAAHRQGEDQDQDQDQLDGKYLLRCSDPHLPAADIALGYKQLLDVRTRPARHEAGGQPRPLSSLARLRSAEFLALTIQ